MPFVKPSDFAERQLLSHKTGTALVSVLNKLQTSEGCSQVQTVLSNQLNRNFRVKYTDLSTIIQQLETTNAPLSSLNPQNKTN